MSTVSFHCPSGSLVDQILEQGQRLRNSMVQSILNNDPFSTSITNDRCIKDAATESNLTADEKQKFIAYIRGDRMSKTEERQALDTFRRMSNVDICDVTDRTCLSYKATCDCDTCKAYYAENAKTEPNEVPPLYLPISNKSDLQKCVDTGSISQPTTVRNLLKYVDSLRIIVHSLTINQEGLKKVYGRNIERFNKLPPSYTHSYFVEYSIPDVLVQGLYHSKSKVDSGLHTNKFRFCTKIIQNEAIQFKQVSMHEITHLDKVNLKTLNLKFQISCRTQKQKGLILLGVAKLNLASFVDTKYFVCNQELALMLDSEAPITLGTLKVSAQLGCGKLYFGKEFVDAICSNKENNVILPENASEEDYIYKQDSGHRLEVTERFDSSRSKEIDEFKSRSAKNGSEILKNRDDKSVNYQQSPISKVLPEITNFAQNLKESTDNKQVLFGFIYIPEAEFLEPLNAYFTVRPFAQDDILYSRLVYSSSNPVFNFYQNIPFLYEDDLLKRMRDNFMVFEFFEKCEEVNALIGVCKVSLHQFYVAFRNASILQYLLRNEFPVIGADWWQPICDPRNGEIHGQVQLLIAFGSESQVQNLEAKRGFRHENVVARTTYLKQRPVSSAKKKPINNPVRKIGSKLKPEQLKKTASVATQMESGAKEDKSVQFNMETESEGNLQNRDVLGSFLSQLIQQRQVNSCVEAGTNTDFKDAEASKIEETPNTTEANTHVGRTSDLLDTLQKALSVDNNTMFSNNTALNENKNSFKAHIYIEEALHLPSRKKCKAKKSKSKTVKHEEILPSTYVTFEAMPTDMKVTCVVQKSCGPKWNYRCDVLLPADLLTKNQKRLIFKVWRKCAGNSLQPNLQTDVIIGFAALDLTVFLAGLPTIHGWFNILDFSSLCNGQIKINVTPLENLEKFNNHKCVDNKELDSPQIEIHTEISTEKVEEPGELLNRTLKRKFTELDEITQRLRSRLSNVTSDEGDGFNDDLVDEFERDINTLCVEDDYDLIDFEEESEKSSNLTMKQCEGLLQIELADSDSTSAHSSILNLTQDNSILQPSNNTHVLDKQLQEGKQRIDTLLEKLSLITNHDNEETFSSRYVSGCSVNQESSQILKASDILKELTLDSKSVDPDCVINPLLFQKLYAASLDSTPPLLSDRTNLEASSSDSSLFVCRAAPDGAGKVPEDKVSKVPNM